jgi:BlaI family penicillinase repressor
VTRDTELGPLEMRILGLLDGRGALAVQDLKAALDASGQELAYTTVMTVLVRLHEKGLVSRAKEGRRYLYSASRGAPKVTRGILARLQKTLFRNDRVRPILTLLDDDTISDAELRALRTAIDDKLKERQ